MRINIELDDYEVVNLLNALKYIPKNGEWHSNVINKITTAVDQIDHVRFRKDMTPNSGIDLPSMRKYMESLSHKAKYQNNQT